MTLIVAILFLLIVSRVAAELAERVGQPAMIGEILAGIILGPALLGLIHPSPELTAIAYFGLLLLVLLAGMDFDLPQRVDAFWAEAVHRSLGTACAAHELGQQNELHRRKLIHGLLQSLPLAIGFRG